MAWIADLVTTLKWLAVTVLFFAVFALIGAWLGAVLASLPRNP